MPEAINAATELLAERRKGGSHSQSKAFPAFTNPSHTTIASSPPPCIFNPLHPFSAMSIAWRRSGQVLSGLQNRLL